MNELKSALLVAAAAVAGGLIGCFYSPKPRTFLKYFGSALISLVLGYTTAHASRLESDHQIFLALIVGIASNNLLYYFLIKAWEDRDRVVNNYTTGNNSQLNQGNITDPTMENKDGQR